MRKNPASCSARSPDHSPNDRHANPSPSSSERTRSQSSLPGTNTTRSNMASYQYALDTLRLNTFRRLVMCPVSTLLALFAIDSALYGLGASSQRTWHVPVTATGEVGLRRQELSPPSDSTSFTVPTPFADSRRTHRVSRGLRGEPLHQRPRLSTRPPDSRPNHARPTLTETGVVATSLTVPALSARG